VPVVVLFQLALIVAAAAGCQRTGPVDAAAAVLGGDAQRGRESIRSYGCDACHTIPGVRGANALVGPPLNQMARRTYIAGHLPNTPENMMIWVRSPQAVLPGTAMPDTGVTDRDARDIVAYLYTLR
jgi:cytochrome c2